MMLLDVMMPMMDGWAFLEELQTLPADERPRVVVVSARSACAIARRPPSSAPMRSSPKPFNVDDLLVVLHDIEQAS